MKATREFGVSFKSLQRRCTADAPMEVGQVAHGYRVLTDLQEEAHVEFVEARPEVLFPTDPDDLAGMLAMKDPAPWFDDKHPRRGRDEVIKKGFETTGIWPVCREQMFRAAELQDPELPPPSAAAAVSGMGKRP